MNSSHRNSAALNVSSRDHLTYNDNLCNLLPFEMSIENSLKSLEVFFSNSPEQISLQQVASSLVNLEKVYHNSEVTSRYWDIVNNPDKNKRDTSMLKQLYEQFGGNGRYSSVLYS